MGNKFISSIILVFVVSSCGKKEVATVDLVQQNPVVISLNLDKGERITFHSVLKMEYKEQPDVVYAFEFYQQEQLLFSGGVDPLNVAEKQPEIGTFKGKLEGEFTAQYNDKYSVAIRLLKNNSEGLKLHEATIKVMKD